MKGMPLTRSCPWPIVANLVLAKDSATPTRMVEKHYGHLAPSFITVAIRAGAPRYGIAAGKRVVPLRCRTGRLLVLALTV